VNEHDDPDEPLVAELRDLFAQADPVPSLVTKVAKASLGWRRLDADLAELLSDSVLEAGSLAGARGGGAPVRSVSFSASAKTIDLEIHIDGQHRILLGQITPPSRARIDIETAENATVTSVESDDLGRFRAQFSAAGRIRLVIDDGPDSSSKIETSWITI
jgi:hypothetical protein